jgi:hypothetical protein
MATRLNRAIGIGTGGHGLVRAANVFVVPV